MKQRNLSNSKSKLYQNLKYLIALSVLSVLNANVYARNDFPADSYSNNACYFSRHVVNNEYYFEYNQAAINYQVMYNVSVSMVGSPLQNQTITYSVFDKASNQYVLAETPATISNNTFSISWVATNTILNSADKKDYMINISGVSYKNGKYKVRAGFEIINTSQLSCFLRNTADYSRTALTGSIIVNVNYWGKFMGVNYSNPYMIWTDKNPWCSSTIAQGGGHKCYGSSNQITSLVNNFSITLPWDFGAGATNGGAYISPPKPSDILNTITWPSIPSTFDYESVLNTY